MFKHHKPHVQHPLLSLHTCELLESLEAKSDFFTLDWLVDSRPEQSYGLIILFLAVMSMIPVVDIPARVVLMFIALRGLVGYSISLPDKLMKRPLSAKYLAQVQKRGVPALHHLERFVRPRWAPVLRIRRLAALLLFLLNFVSLLVPLPLINVPPAAIIFLMALAYLEHDGLLLAIGLAASTVLLIVLVLPLFGLGQFFH